MIGEKRNHVLAAAQYIIDKSLQRLLRSNFHEDARAGIIQFAEAFDELHGRRDLPSKNIHHLRCRVRSRGIELAIHIRDDRHAWALKTQTLQHLPKRFTGRRHNRGVEGVAHRQGHHFVACFLQNFRGVFHCLGCTADHRLMIAVDIGDHHVTLDGLQDSLDFIQRRNHGGHFSVVFHRHAGHLAATGADRFQCVSKRQCSGGNQRSIFTQAMSHGHVGLNAVSGEQPG